MDEQPDGQRQIYIDPPSEADNKWLVQGKCILTRCTCRTSYPAIVHGWVGWIGNIIHVHTVRAGKRLAYPMLIKASKSRRSTFLKTLLGRGRLCDVRGALWAVYGEAVETYLLVRARTHRVHSHWLNMLNSRDMIQRMNIT